jgi:hypothetical protein
MTFRAGVAGRFEAVAKLKRSCSCFAALDSFEFRCILGQDESFGYADLPEQS